MKHVKTATKIPLAAQNNNLSATLAQLSLFGGLVSAFSTFFGSFLTALSQYDAAKHPTAA